MPAGGAVREVGLPVQSRAGAVILTHRGDARGILHEGAVVGEGASVEALEVFRRGPGGHRLVDQG